MEQTAVEWLALRYHHRQGYLSLEDIAEAKAMEKEQIMKANIDGYEEAQNYNESTAEEYYNQNFNNETNK